MPILLLLHFAVAIFFAVHAVRTGQGLYWVFILLMFPMLGSLVYCFAVWMPEMSQSRGARKAFRTVKQTLQPTRGLQDARLALEQADTVRNRLALGDELMAQKQWAAALEQFEAALARDPEAADVQARVADAALWAGQPQRAFALTQALLARTPPHRLDDVPLSHARALAALDHRDEARSAFMALLDETESLEVAAHYAEWLKVWGDFAAVRDLRDEALRRYERMPKHSKELHREAIARIRAAS
jgi:hypothetical protein